MNRMRSLINNKSNQTENLKLKNTITELKKKPIEGFNARFNHAEERFSKLRDR